MTIIGVPREQLAGETRVAAVPDTVTRLLAEGFTVLVEHGAGAAAWFGDETYEKAGAHLVDAAQLVAEADLVACLHPPTGALRRGQTLVGLLDPLRRPEAVRGWAAAGITALSLDLLPRTLSRAQSMDALSSQANIAGYQAVLLAAGAFGRYFPMLTTAAGTTAPARVLVLGAGVAGLAAIGTARRLGAVVTGYDVQPQSRAEVESVGARFLAVTAVGSGAGGGGYARALTAEEQQALRAELAGHLPRFDVVITTAQVPGGPPPVLVSAEALAGMAPGSVVVDIAAGEYGGNVEGVRPGAMVIDRHGVTLIGAGDAPTRMATAAATAYARNLTALLTYLAPAGQWHLESADEIVAGVLVTRDGAVVHPQVAARLAALQQPDPQGGAR